MAAVLGSLAVNAALYALDGLEIFPVNPTNKQPYVSQYEATTNPDQITGWWYRFPTALIGHRIADGIVLTDIDPRHHGHDVWNALRADHAPVETRAHYSGRGDGGGHLWWRCTLTDNELYKVTALETWAKDHQVGEAQGERWTAGIDVLHRHHRYTILPPSPHPETGQPYRWRSDVHAPINDIPTWLRTLIVATKPAPTLKPSTTLTSPNGQSVIEWFNLNYSFNQILTQHGWTLIRGTGQDDGSYWRHPTATAEHSASIRDGCLYVHTPNTPFDPTGHGDPHGYDPFDCWRILGNHGDKSAASRKALELRDGPLPPHIALETLIAPHPNGTTPTSTDDIYLDWPTFWAKDRNDIEWLHEPILARGRGHAIFAGHKVGKSLVVLSIVAQLATGPDLVTIIYLDYEMTEADVEDRLTDMGYGPDTDLTRLRYALLPSLPPLDTWQGAEALHNLVDTELETRPDHHVCVIVDTTSRAVKGEENSADTVRDFYRLTGMGLKRRGVTWARLDHSGKDATKGQRGSSAKGDDVDIVWRVTPADRGLKFHREAARMSWVPEDVELVQHDDPLHYVITTGLWPAGTSEKAQWLDELGAPLNITRREAGDLLRANGYTARNEVVAKALSYRRERTVENLVDN